MDLDEYKKDLFIRYNHIRNRRQTDKQKAKFIRTLLLDLDKLGKEFKVVESKEKTTGITVSRNIYVGDVRTANTIITTYYDTPNTHWGPYVFFNKECQKNQTLVFNLSSAIAVLILGLIITFKFTIPEFTYYKPNILTWLLTGGIYFVLSWTIGLCAKGIASRRNLIRNTSSLLWMLEHLANQIDTSIAYAFVDNGVTNEHGLFSLMQSVKSTAKIYYLDSVGAEAPLYVVHQEQQTELVELPNLTKSGLYRLIAAEQKNGEFYLSKSLLGCRQINQVNFNDLRQIIK